MAKVAIIGAGKMGCALAGGLVQSGMAAPSDITGVARSDASRQRFLSVNSQLNWSADAAEAAGKAEVILLGVKPAQILDICREIASAGQSSLLISVAAGVKLASIQNVMGPDSRVVRAMPNTPVVVREGVTAYVASPGVKAGDKEWVHGMFSSLGYACEVAEEEIDAVTALSGSGPAYFYLFVDLLQKAAVREGLRSDLALEMAARTALGAARMLLESKASPGDLIAQVKSKGGTTEAALKAFSDGGLERIVDAAASAAAKRSRELSK